MRIAFVAIILGLSACGQPEDAATLQPEVTGTTAPQAAEPPASAPAAPVVSTIPVHFLGVWDSESGTCDPASDLRLDVSEDRITFYESVGTVQAVREDAGTTMITLAMEGEGESWTQTIGLRFFDARTSLMVIDPQRPDEAEQNLRRRCFD